MLLQVESQTGVGGADSGAADGAWAFRSRRAEECWGISAKNRGIVEGVRITFDHLGSIREVADATGVLKVRYDYTPFGERVVLGGGFTADMGYTGHYTYKPSWMADTHLLTMYRIYRPDLGRWTARDPIAEDGGINLYAYCNNNPVNCWDPLGSISKQHGKTTESGIMVHSEVVPEKGGGVHVQVGKEKWHFNSKTGTFENLPKWIAKEIQKDKALQKNIESAVNRVNCEGKGFFSKYGGGIGKFIPKLIIIGVIFSAAVEAKALTDHMAEYMDAVKANNQSRTIISATQIIEDLNNIAPGSERMAIGDLLEPSYDQ